MPAPEAAVGRPRIGGRDRDEDLGRLLKRLGLVLVWVACLFICANTLRLLVEYGEVGLDSHAYWAAGRSADPYGAPPGYVDAFLYSPVFLLVVTPFAQLPWPVFLALWIVAEGACFWWLTSDLAWRWRGPVLLLCVQEVVTGNIYGFLGVIVVLGFRRPGLWAFAFLTKVSIGGVGLLWFVVRGEWAAACRVVGWTAAVAGACALLVPGLWVDWATMLLDNRGSGDTGQRLLRWSAAVVVVCYAARRGHRWLVPLSLLLAVPHFFFSKKDLAVLAAAAPLRVRRPPQSASSSRTRGATSVP